MRRVVAHAGGSDGVRAVFFFAHTLVFAVGRGRYAALLEHCNAADGTAVESGCGRELRPLLTALAARKPVPT